MITRSYQVRFTTPAFLGNAEQHGQWRTPPFKAQLRQWWRVAQEADRHFNADVNRLRADEAALFGTAAGNQGTRSRVRILLGRWDEGKMRQWVQDPKVFHQEVGNGGKQIGAHLYLGYGPLNFRSGTFLGKKEGRDFKARAAIQAGEQAHLQLAFPDEHAPLLDTALSLMHHYGALGGRSRNGWGSLLLIPEDSSPEHATPNASISRHWRDALRIDWPHALGRDEKGLLVWQTGPFSDWKGVMRKLAEIKIGLRTRFEFSTGHNAPCPEQRHWLSYPVTNHSVRTWRNRRLPNSLRFKVRPAPGEPRKLVGTIFHVPCLPPSKFNPNRRVIEDVWKRVHSHLDDLDSIHRNTV